MTDEAHTPIDTEESRRARLAARRRRNMRIGIAALVVVLGAGAAVGAYAMNSDDSGAKPSSSANSNGQPGPTELPEVQAARKKAALRTLSHDKPLRVWVGGDSLAGAFGPPLGDSLGATGVAETLIDYKVSSGLWGDDVRDWEERATEQMASSNPEVVVFMIGTNDASAVNKVDSDDDGVPDWEALYRAEVNRMLDTFVGGEAHRSVFLLGAPTLGTEWMDDAAVELNRVLADEAGKRKTDVVYVDAYRLFSVPSGEFSRYIVDENGEDIQARIGDGVHFTPSGAEYLARAVFTLIDARWNLNKQADAKKPIAWTLAEGSGEQVPGYSSRPQSRYRNPSYQYQPTTPPTAATTPPTVVTAPPSTSAPVVTTPPTVVTTPKTNPPVSTPHPPPGDDD